MDTQLELHVHIPTVDPVGVTAVVALAGRRIDARAVAHPRFPLDAVPAVSAALAAVLQPDIAHTLVCSAACGADLVALDVAGRSGVPRHVVLPFEPALFRRTSVADRPGDWGPLFDRVIADVSAAGALTVSGSRVDDPRAYTDTNARILALATALATSLAAADGVSRPRAALVVWDGAPRGPDDATAHFRDAARDAGFVLLPAVSTLRHAPDAA